MKKKPKTKPTPMPNYRIHLPCGQTIGPFRAPDGDRALRDAATLFTVPAGAFAKEIK